MTLLKSIGTVLFLIMITIGGASAFNQIGAQDIDISLQEQLPEDPIGTTLNVAKVYVGYDNLVPAEYIQIGDFELMIPHPALSDLIFIGLFFLIFWIAIHFIPSLIGRVIIDTTLLIILLAISYVLSKLFFYYVIFKPSLSTLGFPDNFGYDLIKTVSEQTAPMHGITLAITLLIMGGIALAIYKGIHD